MEAVADIVDASNSASPVFFRHYVPGRPLSEFVGVFWYWRGHDVRYSKERILPTGTAELKHHPAVSFAMKEFQRDPGLLSCAAVAEKVNLSQRRFIQLFRDEVGMTPKLFCRVQRFHAVITKTSKLETVDWVDVALSHGYFDQSHFIHDFQEFSGLTPSQYLGLRTEHLNHIRVRD